MLFGVLLGLVLAEVLVLREMSMPMVIFAYAIPHPVVAPVFIIWFITVLDPIVLLEFTGPSAYLLRSVTAKEATRQFVLNGVTTFAAWVGFFPVFLGTITGMNALEERFEHPGTVLGATRFQMVRYFRFWRALPNIASSQGVGYQIVLALGRGAAVAAHGGEHERLETGPLDSRDDTADDRGQVCDSAAANPQGDLAAIGNFVGRQVPERRGGRGPDVGDRVRVPDLLDHAQLGQGCLATGFKDGCLRDDQRGTRRLLCHDRTKAPSPHKCGHLPGAGPTRRYPLTRASGPRPPS